MGNKKKLKKNKILLYLFITAVITLGIIIYLLPKLTGVLTQTSIVEYGNLRVASNEVCYFIRDEEIVKASSSGNIQYYCEEGELVRAGTKVLDIVSATSYTAPKNGIISYYTDGYEDKFTPGKMASLKKEEIEALEIKVSDTKRDNAIAGEPLFKVVENSHWYVVLWASPDNVIKYEKGKPVILNLPLGQVKGSTYDIIDAGDSWLVLLKFSRYYEEMQRIRKIEAEVVTSDYEGLIIANKSITTNEGKPGVYVKDIGGDFVFTKVSVLASDGEYSIIESSFFYEKKGDESLKVKTVNAYDEILNYPERKND